MQQAVFTISGAELNQDVLERIKSLFNRNAQDLEVVIRVKVKESREEMRRRIDQAIEDIEHGENLISYTPDEFETLVQQLSQR